MNRQTLINELRTYIPYNEQEERDRELILKALEEDDIYLRDNTRYHIFASSFIVNKEHTKVLMCFHNIYKSFSWLGGHADGEEDLIKVAINESKEESGIKDFKLVSDKIFSIEVLTVDGHIKRGKYVSSHLHLNVTYLLEADEDAALHIKEDENSALKWIPIEKLNAEVNEKWMLEHIYQKLVDKLFLLTKKS